MVICIWSTVGRVVVATKGAVPVDYACTQKVSKVSLSALVHCSVFSSNLLYTIGPCVL